MLPRFALLTMAATLAMAASASAADLKAVETYAVITGTAATAGSPAGPQLRPMSVRIVDLGTGSALVYYTHDDRGMDAIRVVTTMSTGASGAATPAQFIAYLMPGQRAEISVAGPAGTEPASLELKYDGRQLMVRPAAATDPQG